MSSDAPLAWDMLGTPSHTLEWLIPPGGAGPGDDALGALTLMPDTQRMVARDRSQKPLDPEQSAPLLVPALAQASPPPSQ